MICADTFRAGAYGMHFLAKFCPIFIDFSRNFRRFLAKIRIGIQPVHFLANFYPLLIDFWLDFRVILAKIRRPAEAKRDESQSGVLWVIYREGPGNFSGIFREFLMGLAMFFFYF
jgi:hypothetical protein